MSKKVYAIVIVMVALVVGAIILQKGRGVSPQKENAKTHSPLHIGLTTWVGDGVYYVAKAKGFFDAEKVQVEFVNIADTGAAKQLLLSGKIDALYLTPETAVVLAAAGGKIKIVNVNDLSSGADGVVAAANIEKVEDLKGKTVAFEVGSPSHFLLSYLLQQKGLSTSDMTVVNNLAADAGAAFVAGKVDAAVTWEPWLSQASERAGGHVLASSKDVRVIYDMPIFWAEVVEQRREEVRGLLRALFASQKFIAAHPGEAAQIIAAEFKITPDEAAAQMQGVRWLNYEENVQSLARGQYSVQNALQAAADLWLSLGLIQAPVAAGNLIDESLLSNLYQ